MVGDGASYSIRRWLNTLFGLYHQVGCSGLCDCESQALQLCAHAAGERDAVQCCCLGRSVLPVFHLQFLKLFYINVWNLLRVHLARELAMISEYAAVHAELRTGCSEMSWMIFEAPDG